MARYTGDLAGAHDMVHMDSPSMPVVKSPLSVSSSRITMSPALSCRESLAPEERPSTVMRPLSTSMQHESDELSALPL